MPIRALLLDLGDTLFGLDPMPRDLPGRAEVAFAAADLPSAESLAAEALAAVRTFLRAAAEAGSTDEVPIVRIVAHALAAHGEPTARAAGSTLDRVMGEADVSRFRDGAATPPVLRQLRAAGLRLVAVSNTLTDPGLLLRHPVSAPALAELHGAVFSVAAGVRKPGAAIYVEALELAGVTAAETLFVGDRAREDVAGPSAVGIRAVLTHQFRAEDPGASRPVAVIRDLSELEGVVSTSSGG